MITPSFHLYVRSSHNIHIFKISCADSSAHSLAPFEDPKHFFYTAQGLLLCAKYFSAAHLLPVTGINNVEINEERKDA